MPIENQPSINCNPPQILPIISTMGLTADPSVPGLPGALALEAGGAVQSHSHIAQHNFDTPPSTLSTAPTFPSSTTEVLSPTISSTHAAIGVDRLTHNTI